LGSTDYIPGYATQQEQQSAIKNYFHAGIIFLINTVTVDVGFAVLVGKMDWFTTAGEVLIVGPAIKWVGKYTFLLLQIPAHGGGCGSIY